MIRARSGSGIVILCVIICIVACVFFAVLVQTVAVKLPAPSIDRQSDGPRLVSRPPPSLARDADWRWAAAIPGGNVYIESRVEPGIIPDVSVWTARRLIASQAGIAQDRLELIEFDCARHRSRSVLVMLPYRGSDGREHMDTHPAGNSWGSPRPQSAMARMLETACTKRADRD